MQNTSRPYTSRPHAAHAQQHTAHGTARHSTQELLLMSACQWNHDPARAWDMLAVLLCIRKHACVQPQTA